MTDEPESPVQAPDLVTRILDRLDVENPEDTRRRDLLAFALARMMDSPTAREQAAIFMTEDMKAAVRFASPHGSPAEFGADGILFGSAIGLSGFEEGRLFVTLHDAYLTAEHNRQNSEVPDVLCHELFGHGIWSTRAEREKCSQAVHHHELNEINARLLGWIVEFERTGRVRRGREVQQYLADPTAFAASLKLRLPYYALTFSSAEMAQSEETLAARATQARTKKSELERELSNHRSWNPVIDHFVRHHGVAEADLTALRHYMAKNDDHTQHEIEHVTAVIDEVEATLGRLKVEPDKVSSRYLEWAANCPLVEKLRCETEANDRRLRALIGAQVSDPEMLPLEHWPFAEPGVWVGQITFDDIVALYRRDREENPHHWSDMAGHAGKGRTGRRTK